MTLATVLDRIDAGREAALARLLQLLEIPSVSTDPAHAGDCRRAAEWLAEELRGLGMTVAVHETPGHPMVVGHGEGAGPHVLFYGHYDVQPADPVDLWDHPPFAPRIEETPAGPVIRGRGASDDKGQLMTFLEACRGWREVTGALPCRLTVFFEGEEESGSPSLVPFLRDNAATLKAEIALICDTGLFADRVPAIVTQLRGLVGEEVVVTGADKDLHSGLFGGVAVNPARALARALAGLHDEAGRVALPGFYDGVDPLPDALATQWDRLAFDATAFLSGVGLSAPAGERGKRPLEMMWSEPTCEINGMWSGYTGPGFKTVLPAEAGAKVSFRLVGRQDPERIRETFRAHVRAAMPPDCTVVFSDHGGSPASRMATEHPAFEAARTALSDEWPHPAAFIGGGGSIPVAGHFQDILGMDSMLIGFAKDDDRIHSPNEKYDLDSFTRGARSWARILDALAQLG